MMTTIRAQVQLGTQTLRRWVVDPRVHTLLQTIFRSSCGFLLGAASLGSRPMPVALGLVCVLEGWAAVLVGLGGALGYLVFWGSTGVQGAGWMATGLLAALLLGSRPVRRRTALLMPAIASFLVSAWGVAFQLLLADHTPVPAYLLRVVLAGGCAWVFQQTIQRREVAADWLTGFLAVLALAQVWPVRWLGLGCVAAGILSSTGTLPAAALAGLGLDLAQVTPMPMTALLCLCHLVRLIPIRSRWLQPAAMAGLYVTMMGILGTGDLAPLPGLLLGSGIGLLLPGTGHPVRRRGETGVTQVRLEMAAGAMSQMEQLLLETREKEIDEEALVQRGAEQACGGCPCRKTCRDVHVLMDLPVKILHRPLLSAEDLPIRCKKPGRVLQAFQRSQEQLRLIRAGRDRVRESRTAVIQQYQFLAEYLRDLSDQLGERAIRGEPDYSPEIGCATVGREETDGDQCLWFAGVAGKYYVLLCDGMGTGLGAAQEGRDAARILRRLLSAGYPAEYALRSLNSLCALRGRAGAVTVDLAELRLDTGKATLYKWGGAPSWLIGAAAAEKIGTAGPPPGLSVTDGRETVERLSLRRGETLVLLSDGVDGEEARRCCMELSDLPPGELAERVLERGRGEQRDDASVILVRLKPQPLST